MKRKPTTYALIALILISFILPLLVICYLRANSEPWDLSRDINVASPEYFDQSTDQSYGPQIIIEAPDDDDDIDVTISLKP